MSTKKPSKQLHISISEDALAAIDSNARICAMNRSEYIRSSALNAPLEVPPIPTEVLSSLCKISTILTKNDKQLGATDTNLLKKEVEQIWQSLNS